MGATRPSPGSAGSRAPSRFLLAASGAILIAAVAVLIVILTRPAAPFPTRPAAPFRFFSDGSVWNSPLSAAVAVDPASQALVTHLNQEVSKEAQGAYGPTINTAAYSVPIYTVSADQPAAQVTLDTTNPALARALSSVPLPRDAHPATGTDGLLVVWQPSENRMWEFWRLHRVGGQWHARWGGAMRDVEQSNGVFSTRSWPGAQSYWGASATSLPEVGGLMLIDEIRRGSIDHALQLGIPGAREHVYALPAQRTDGDSSSPAAVPEGARLRIKPSVDLSKLHLPRFTLMVARAAQRYGMIVHDSSGVVTLYAQDPTPTGADPYYGRHAFFQGLNPRQLLARFPWQDLEVMKMSLRTQPY
jgi:hypothetical protein